MLTNSDLKILKNAINKFKNIDDDKQIMGVGCFFLFSKAIKKLDADYNYIMLLLKNESIEKVLDRINVEEQKLFNQLDLKYIYNEINKESNENISRKIMMQYRDLSSGVTLSDVINYALFSLKKTGKNDHLTSDDVAKLMSNIIMWSCDKKENLSIIDYSSGVGTLLKEASFLFENCKLTGIEISQCYCYLTQLEALIEGINLNIINGDGLSEEYNEKYDLAIINPPFVNLNKTDIEFEAFEFKFWKKVIEHLNDNGKAIILTSGKPFSSGKIDSKDNEYRKFLLENDFIESIIKLPCGLFVNTMISFYIVLINKNKDEKKKGYIQIIDAINAVKSTDVFFNNKKSLINDSTISKIYDDYLTCLNDEMIDNNKFLYNQILIKVPYRHNYCINYERINVLKKNIVFNNLYDENKYNDLIKDLKNNKDIIKKMDKGRKLQSEIIEKLKKQIKIENKVYLNRAEFVEYLKAILPEKIDNTLFKSIVECLSENDRKADLVYDNNGNILYDKKLKKNDYINFLDNENEYLKNINLLYKDAIIEFLGTFSKIEINKYTSVKTITEVLSNEDINYELNILYEEEKKLKGKLFND